MKIWYYFLLINLIFVIGIIYFIKNIKTVELDHDGQEKMLKKYLAMFRQLRNKRD